MKAVIFDCAKCRINSSLHKCHMVIGFTNSMSHADENAWFHSVYWLFCYAVHFTSIANTCILV